MREHRFDLKSVPPTAENLCDAFDYDALARHAKLLVDTRGRYPKAAGNIVKA